MRMHIDLPEKIQVPFIVEVYKDGELFLKSNESKVDFPVAEAGVYRVKVRIQPKLPFPDEGKWVGWIYSNPFFISE